MLQFRALEDRDEALVETWLHKEHVKRWYDIPHMGVSISDWIEEIKARYGQFQWITYLVVSLQGDPIGFCQYYRCIDSLDEDFGSMPVDGAYGIDYLIGQEVCLGRGFGKQMITLLVERIFTFPDAQRITADIDNENQASRNVLLSCGFALLDAGGSRYVLERKRQS